jgi:hypothetical protein
MYERKADIGQIWAYRERAYTVDCPVVKAEVLQLGPRGSGKVRIRLLEEYEGMDMWVPLVRLRVPWEEAEDWLRDEQALQAVIEASVGAKGGVAYESAQLVFWSYPGQAGVMLDVPSDGVLWITDPEAAAADLDLGMDWLLSVPSAFIDRKGEYHAPGSFAETIARRITEKYPEEVLAYIAKEEKELQDGAVYGTVVEYGTRKPWSYEVPPERCAERLREMRPVFDLIREWCGQPAADRYEELNRLRGEVKRLEDLVLETADRLEEAGNMQLARRLRKQVSRPERKRPPPSWP